ncbi:MULTISPECIES: DMT family transporter [unclassified Roseovarius]|uniref:DMT family transporter n=1 Tax=unclassified Roseovarius TaxID=2614913 RepID=UPI00273DC83B|nr:MULTISPECIES: DMT family transporter [unclassified Roseovarius]
MQVHSGIARRFGFTAPSTATLGALAAWVAVVIYAASNSIVTLLVGIGEANPISGGVNAITYTNLYLLGSLISLLPMALLYRRDLTRANLRRLTPHQWRLLGISAVLSSVLTPGLFFYALEHTTVTNIVLVGRIEPPLFLLATWFFLRERLNPWAMLAGLTALTGAIVVIGTGSNAGMLTLGKGEVATVAATLSFIASTIVTRVGLRDVPIGIFAVFRTGLGASLYFVLVAGFFGLDSFEGVFEPIVWQWVWVYAILIIVLGQIAWNYGLKHARAGDVALATSFSPLAAILIAMALLGEDPGPGLIPGAAIILLAIAIGHFGRHASDQAENQPKDHMAILRPQWESAGWMQSHVAVRPFAPQALYAPPPGERRPSAEGRAGPLSARPPGHHRALNRHRLHGRC